jgi:hypothetical protein
MINIRRKIVKVLITAIMLLTIIPSNTIPAYSVDAISFPDVPSSAWYLDDLQYILDDARQIFAGYPDGTFKPNDTLTADMYIKLIVTVMGHKVENGKEYWASTYIQKAIEEGYIVASEDSWIVRKRPEDEYFGYKQPIYREDMAKITGRALDIITDDSEYRDPLSVCEMIKDYMEVSIMSKTNVIKCYDLGILNGFPDGEFKPKKILTRAEAVAVIRRLIDKSSRIIAELPIVANPSPTPIPLKELNRPQKKDLGNGVVEVEGVRFDPEKDIVRESTKTMGILKAEEFVDVFLQHLKFYEHDGKARVRGYIPELPEGHEWNLAIRCNFKEADDRGYWTQGLFTRDGLSPEQTLPNSGCSFDRSLFTNKENIGTIYLNFKILSPVNDYGGSFYISLNLKVYSRYDAYGGHDMEVEFDPRGFIEW